ncbi:beta-lactamase family protein [Clostridium estertheticum]|uniref:serine hydrolase domain-containing protein n=1 Tax=Clostridium estertheticum TaxID=238834 RepID=UPI0013EE9986|nr:serine hydrolase [Clostridium estertheticum]MBZ9607831.1 beta-lactamase family protein [Clostridium estertheticum]
MKVLSRFICLLVTVIILIPLFSTNIALAESSDQSVQAFEQMSDEYMKKVLDEYKVAGVTVSVVKDGQVFFKKGYGYADLEKKIPVDPDKTDFQIASISKLITATAAMKLVDEGKLSLDEDVNKYLTDFKIKNDFSKPVTLRNLLTHTAGLDDRLPLYYKSTGDKFYDSVEPLGEFLKINLPPVITKPGSYWQYSVHGFALVGYLVEKASGMTIDKYVTDYILKPLQMENSSYWLNKGIIGNMSRPYKYEKGEFLDAAYTLCSDHPSGAVCATASDMAKFMIMHLNNGEYNGVRILNESTAQEMHKRNYSSDEKLLGYGLGFYENIRNGHKVIEHNGYLPSFSSLLSIMPEKNIGIFISLNTDSKDSSNVCNEFANKIYEFFTTKINRGEKEDALNTNVPFDMDIKKINGMYAMDSYPHTDLTKIKCIAANSKIKCDNKGKLTFSYGNDKINYQYIGNGIFYSKEENDYCKISEKNNQMIFSILSFDFEKIPDINIYLFYAVIAGLAAFLISIIVIFISLFTNRKLKDKQVVISKSVVIILSFLMIMYIVLNGIMCIKSMQADTSIVFHTIIPLIRIICYLSFIFTIISSIYIINYWIKNKLLLRWKVLYSVIIMASVINILFMYIMNGFKL